VIRLRIQGLGAPELAELLRTVITQYESELRAGALITVKSRKMTHHRFSIGAGI